MDMFAGNGYYAELLPQAAGREGKDYLHNNLPPASLDLVLLVIDHHGVPGKPPFWPTVPIHWMCRSSTRM